MKPWLVAWFLTSSCIAQHIYVPPPMPRPAASAVKSTPAAPKSTSAKSTTRTVKANSATTGNPANCGTACGTQWATACSAAGYPTIVTPGGTFYGCGGGSTAVTTNGTGPNPSWPNWNFCGLNLSCYSGSQVPSTSVTSSGARQSAASASTYYPSGTPSASTYPSTTPSASTYYPSRTPGVSNSANPGTLATGLTQALDNQQRSAAQNQALAAMLGSALNNQSTSGTLAGSSPSTAAQQACITQYYSDQQAGLSPQEASNKLVICRSQLPAIQAPSTAAPPTDSSSASNTPCVIDYTNRTYTPCSTNGVPSTVTYGSDGQVTATYPNPSSSTPCVVTTTPNGTSTAQNCQNGAAPSPVDLTDQMTKALDAVLPPNQ